MELCMELVYLIAGFFHTLHQVLYAVYEYVHFSPGVSPIYVGGKSVAVSRILKMCEFTHVVIHHRF